MNKRYSILTIAAALGTDPVTLKKKCYDAHILYGKGLTIAEIEYVINREEQRTFKNTVDHNAVAELKKHFK